LDGDYSCVGGAGLAGKDGKEVDNGSRREERRDEVDAVGDGAEGGVKDGLCYPYDEGEVDEDVDDGCEGDNHPHKNIEEVVPVAHLFQLSSLFLPAFDNSNRIIHILII